MLDAFQLGDVVISRAAKFHLGDEFRHEVFNGRVFRSDWALPTSHLAEAQKLMAGLTAQLAEPPLATGQRAERVSTRQAFPSICQGRQRLTSDTPAGRFTMSVVQNAVVIGRPPGEVVAYCSDMTTESEWNPAAQKVTKVGPEPVGPGTRYTGQWSGVGEGSAEIVEFSPPERWRTSCDFARVKALIIGEVQPVSETSHGFWGQAAVAVRWAQAVVSL